MRYYTRTYIFKFIRKILVIPISYDDLQIYE